MPRRQPPPLLQPNPPAIADPPHTMLRGLVFRPKHTHPASTVHALHSQSMKIDFVSRSLEFIRRWSAPQLDTLPSFRLPLPRASFTLHTNKRYAVPTSARDEV